MAFSSVLPFLLPTHSVDSGLKIASNWSPWATKNRPGRIEIMTREPIFFFFFIFFFYDYHYRYYYLKRDEKLVKFYDVMG